MRTEGELRKAWREAAASLAYVEVGHGAWIVSGAGLKKDVDIEEVDGEAVRNGEMFLCTDTGDCCRILAEQELVERMEQGGNLLDYDEFYDAVFNYAANGDTAFDTCRQDPSGKPIPKDLTDAFKRCVRETAEEVGHYFQRHPEAEGFETPELDEIVKEVFEAFEEAQTKEAR